MVPSAHKHETVQTVLFHVFNEMFSSLSVHLSEKEERKNTRISAHVLHYLQYMSSERRTLLGLGLCKSIRVLAFTRF